MMRHPATITLLVVALIAPLGFSAVMAQDKPVDPTTFSREERIEHNKKVRDERRKALRERRTIIKKLGDENRLTPEEKSRRSEARRKAIEERKALLERPQTHRNAREALTGRNMADRRRAPKHVVKAKRNYIRAQRQNRAHQNRHNQRIAILKRILELSIERGDQRSEKQASLLLDKEQTLWRSMRAQNARRLSHAKANLTRAEKTDETRPSEPEEEPKETP